MKNVMSRNLPFTFTTFCGSTARSEPRLIRVSPETGEPSARQGYWQAAASIAVSGAMSVEAAMVMAANAVPIRACELAVHLRPL